MDSVTTILSEEITQRIGWVLVHFLWQGCVIMTLAWCVFKAFGKASSNIRYLAACIGLGMMAAAPAVTFIASGSKQVVIVPEGTAVMALVVENVRPSVPPTQAIITSAEPAAPGSLKEILTAQLEAALPYCVSGWVIGVAALSLWYLGGWCQLQRLRQIGTKGVSETVSRKTEELARLLGIQYAVRIAESALVQVPVVIGWLKPVILLPATALTGLDEIQLRALIAHELAHIKRYDYVVNIAQTIVEILGFYHPAVWWMSRQIRVERENCCDDIAVAILQNPKAYAKALFSMEEIRAKQLDLAVAANGAPLTNRILRLIGNKSDQHPKSGWIPSIVTIIFVAGLLITTAMAMNNKPAAESITDNDARVYQVNRSVSDFPESEDFSTPENAYAVINRVMAADDYQGWQRVSIKRLSERLTNEGQAREKKVDPEWVRVVLNARILEVRITGDQAVVIAEFPQELTSKPIKNPIDSRYLRYEDGKWLNTGEDRFDGLQQAYQKYDTILQNESKTKQAYKTVLDNPDKFSRLAQELFDTLRKADYENVLSHYDEKSGQWRQDGWKKLDLNYTVHSDWSSFALWVCKTFKDNPIKSGELGEVFISDKEKAPAVPYKLVLQDGGILEGDLYFAYRVNSDTWQAAEGIDWHLQDNPIHYHSAETQTALEHLNIELEPGDTKVIKQVMDEIYANPVIIENIAKELFEKIQKADYDYFLTSKKPGVWMEFPICDSYRTYRDYPELVQWICKVFKANPIVKIGSLKASVHENTWPIVDYVLCLKDGATIQGTLKFEYHRDGNTWKWYGIHDIDWHLQDNPIHYHSAETQSIFEVLNIELEPVAQGKNILYTTVKNTSDTAQLFAIHIYTRSVDYGPDGIGWGTPFFEKLQPNETKRTRFVYQIQGPVTENTYVRIKVYNPATEKSYDYDKPFAEHFYKGSGLQKRKISKTLKPASDAQYGEVSAMLKNVQDYIRNKDYEKAWDLFAEDYKKAGYQVRGFEAFKRQMEPEHKMDSAFTWGKSDFLKLLPAKAYDNNGTVQLHAVCDSATWTVDFTKEGKIWKIDWIAGYKPAVLDMPETDNAEAVQAARMESMNHLRKLGTAHQMFMNDNGNNPPAELQDLKPYLENEILYSWLIDNAVLLKLDKPIDEPAKTPIAYDIALLKTDEGTTILFADGHVEFRPKDTNGIFVLYPNAKSQTWEKAFYDLYRLDDGQIVRRIAPPFIPERKDYYTTEESYQAKELPEPPDYFTFHWDGKLKKGGLGFMGNGNTLDNVLRQSLNIPADQFEGPAELLNLTLPGDWIVRNGSTDAEKLKALEGILKKEIGKDIRFESRNVQRDVIVAKGTFKFTPPSGTYDDKQIHFYADKLDPDEGSGGGTADTVAALIAVLGQRTGLQVIDETTNSSEQIRQLYGHHRSSGLRSAADQAEKKAKLNLMLKNMEKQTNLTFIVEERPVSKWFVVE